MVHRPQLPGGFAIHHPQFAAICLLVWLAYSSIHIAQLPPHFPIHFRVPSSFSHAHILGLKALGSAWGQEVDQSEQYLHRGMCSGSLTFLKRVQACLTVRGVPFSWLGARALRGCLRCARGRGSRAVCLCAASCSRSCSPLPAASRHSFLRQNPCRPTPPPRHPAVPDRARRILPEKRTGHGAALAGGRLGAWPDVAGVSCRRLCGA